MAQKAIVVMIISFTAPRLLLKHFMTKDGAADDQVTTKVALWQLSVFSEKWKRKRQLETFI